MKQQNQPLNSDNFDIIFQKMEEAKNEQTTDFFYTIDQSIEAHETIALFKEYQQSLIESSYSTFTRV